MPVSSTRIKRTKTNKSSNNDFYTGRFGYNKRNGYGVCFFANGNRYEGDWKDNHTGRESTITTTGTPSKGAGPVGQRSGYGKHTYHLFSDEGSTGANWIVRRWLQERASARIWSVYVQQYGNHEFFKQEEGIILKNCRKWGNDSLTRRGLIRRAMNIFTHNWIKNVYNTKFKIKCLLPIIFSFPVSSPLMAKILRGMCFHLFIFLSCTTGFVFSNWFFFISLYLSEFVRIQPFLLLFLFLKWYFRGRAWKEDVLVLQKWLGTLPNPSCV